MSTNQFRSIRHLGTALAALACFAVAPAAAAQEYSVYGSVTAQATASWSDRATPATTFSLPLSATLTQAVTGEAFDLTARTTLSSSTDTPSGISLALPELSLSAYPSGWLTTRIGRFDLDWGTGYVFSPGNALAGVTGDAAAVNGVSLSVIPGFTTIGASLSIADPRGTTAANPFDEVTATAWADGYAGGVDWFAGAQYEHDRLLRPSAGISVDVAGTIAAVEGAIEFAERFSYPAASLAFVPREDPIPLVSVALQRTLSGQKFSASLTGEYLYNGLGYAPEEAERVYDLVDAGTLHPTSEDGASPPLGMHYAAGELSVDWVDVAGVALSAIVNASDGSLSGTGELTIRTLPAIDFYLRSTVMWGASRRTEFGIAGNTATTALGTRINL